MKKSHDSSLLLAFLVIVSALIIPTNTFAQSIDKDSNSILSKAYATSAQLTSVDLRTDKPSYNQGDTVNISGKLSQVIPNTNLSIRITNPTKQLILVSSLMPMEDGSFSKMIIAAGTLWRDAGNYNVEIQYGSHVQNLVTFYFSGSNEQFIVNPLVTEIYHLKSGKQIYEVPYIIQGGVVKNMELFADNFTLEMNIIAPTEGNLIVTIPRNILDSQTSDGNDGQFRVTLNRIQYSQFTETKSNNLRTISIPFPVGNSEISIIGTVTGVNVVFSKGASSQDCISSNCLFPNITTIGIGSTVSWTNNDTTSHTVTSGMLADQTGFFDSSMIEAGKTYNFKFNNVGTFNYYCQIHPWITGQIIVNNGLSPSVANFSEIDNFNRNNIFIETDKPSYKVDDLATINTIVSNPETDQNVAVIITNPDGINIITLIIKTDSQGFGTFQFKIPQNSKFGTYMVIATSLAENDNLKTLNQFTVSS